MFILKEEDYNNMIQYAKDGRPEEVCGLLGGTIEGNKRKVKKVYYLENIDHTNEHFSMDPKEQFQAIKDMRQNGYQLLGNWHSHPETPSRPSEEDKRLAFDSKSRYLILSLAEPEKPVLNAFIIENQTEVSKDPLVLVSKGN